MGLEWFCCRGKRKQKENKMKYDKLLKMTAVMVAIQVCMGGSAWAQAAEEKVEMGTDPRDFAPKFMPYYRTTELENGYKQQDLVMFGMLALTPKVALTYEIPIAQERDASDIDFGPGGPSTNEEKKETGLGDSNVRLLARLGSWAGGDWITGAQLDIPTSSSDYIGSNQLSLGPNLTYVTDLDFWPGPGAFFAMMNFYFFDVFETSDPNNPTQNSSDRSQYVGRYFFMLPLTNPDLGALGGLYLLPEVQPVYDFETDDFSLWIGPEFGKMISEGNIIYAKPGWGIDNTEGADREFTFEIGYRLFL
jgi:hypothetical protein